MKGIFIILFLTLLIFSSPTYNNGQIINNVKDVENNSFWLFSTGNETINKIATIKLADGTTYNASVSHIERNIEWYVGFYSNMSIDYYYTDDGFILGYNETGSSQYLDGNYWYANKSQFVFSSFNSNNHTAKSWASSIIYTNEFNITRNSTRTYSFEHLPSIQYKMANSEIVKAIPFKITSNPKNEVGISTVEYFNKTEIYEYKNGNINFTTIYTNGTIFNDISELRNGYEIYEGYYIPALYRVIDLTTYAYGEESDVLSLNSINIQESKGDPGNPLNDKFLFEYYIDEEYYKTTEDTPTTTTVKPTTTTEKPTTTTVSPTGTTSSELITIQSSTTPENTNVLTSDTPIFTLEMLIISVVILVLLRRKQ